MYEMEGPRLVPRCPGSRLLGHRTLRGTRLAATAGRLLGRRASRGGCPAALANRLLRCFVPRGATGRQAPRRPRRLPGPSIVPEVSLGADPVFSGERFLLPIGRAAQGLFPRSSRFFCRPQDICCLSPVHGRFPPRSAQLRPQLLGITGPPTWGLRARTARAPRTHHPRRPARSVEETGSARRGHSETRAPGWTCRLRKDGTS